MKSFLIFVCVMLACVCFGLFTYCIDTDYQVTKWRMRVAEASQFERDIKHAAKQFEAMKVYVENLTDTIGDMAAENSLLCKRDAKMVETVAAYDEENRRLKSAVKEAVKNMQAQDEEMNNLMEENERLRYRVGTLEDALETIKEAKARMEADMEARQKAEQVTDVMLNTPYLNIVVTYILPVLF